MTAEVDWGEAKVLLAGVVVEVGLFLMRACFSGAAFVMAFEVQSQQAFFEGHVHALSWFGGVFETIRYENVPRHIFVVLFPTAKCARPSVAPVLTGADRSVAALAAT